MRCLPTRGRLAHCNLDFRSLSTVWSLSAQMAISRKTSQRRIPMAAPSRRTGKLDIRISPQAKRVLQEAARERHTTISQFVINSALSAATDVLAERTRIGLNSEQWTAFLAALDAPMRRHPRMERLLKEPTILD